MSETALIRSIDALGSSMSADDFIELRSARDVIRKRAAELVAMIDEASVEFIDRTGIEPETLDGKRFYVGKRKTTKCKSPAATLDAILSAVGGDVETVASFMSANAWKPGACREALDGEWSEHFTVEESKDLKTGKAKKTLLLADDRYTAR